VSSLEGASYATVLPVRKLDRALKFYTETLGAKLIVRPEGEMGKYFASVELGKTEFWLLTPSRRERRELAYSAFTVRDIKSVVNNLKERGVKFQRAEKTRTNRVEGSIAYDEIAAVAFFKDTEGNLLLITQLNDIAE
jgi:catechol 2,3-dioxygenase-like lactoylglutathione lyase family enzyme